MGQLFCLTCSNTNYTIYQKQPDYIERISVEQENIVQNINVTEDNYGPFWENGLYYCPYYLYK